MPHEWLRPARFGDVFVTLGSGQKLHVMALTHATSTGMRLACCGRRGRKVTVDRLHQAPPNVARRHEVCEDCREFCRGVSV